MPAELFDRRPSIPFPTSPGAAPEAVFAARPRLLLLRDTLARAARQSQRSRWKEAPLFFFDRIRQRELEAARSAVPDRFAEPAALIANELPSLFFSVEMRRAARAIDGLAQAAAALASQCPEARDLTELLAIPDDEVFLLLDPLQRAGARLLLRGAATVAQLYRYAKRFMNMHGFQLFLPGALQADGTLHAGFDGCAQWLWTTQPLTVVPRINGERVALVGAAVVNASLDIEPRFPSLTEECELVERLGMIQTTELLSRLCGQPLPMPAVVPTLARAA